MVLRQAYGWQQILPRPVVVAGTALLLQRHLAQKPLSANAFNLPSADYTAAMFRADLV